MEESTTVRELREFLASDREFQEAFSSFSVDEVPNDSRVRVRVQTRGELRFTGAVFLASIDDSCDTSVTWDEPPPRAEGAYALDVFESALGKFLSLPESPAARIRRLVPPGEPLYLLVRHTTRSNVQRVIDVLTFHNGRPEYLTEDVARVLSTLRASARHDTVREGVTVRLRDWSSWTGNGPSWGDFVSALGVLVRGNRAAFRVVWL